MVGDQGSRRVGHGGVDSVPELRGERTVHRPTFGCDIPRLIFSPNSDAQAAATQALVQSSLQQWMGGVIEVEAVEVQNIDSTLSVFVQYVVRQTRERQIDQFLRGGS